MENVGDDGSYAGSFNNLLLWITATLETGNFTKLAKPDAFFRAESIDVLSSKSRRPSIFLMNYTEKWVSG